MKTIVLDVVGQADVEAEAVSCVEAFLRQRGFTVDVQCPNGLVAIVSAQQVEAPAEITVPPVEVVPQAGAVDPAGQTVAVAVPATELPPMEPASMTKDCGTCKIWSLTSNDIIPCTFDGSLEVTQLHVEGPVEMVGDAVCFGYCGYSFKVPISAPAAVQKPHPLQQFTPSSIRVTFSINDGAMIDCLVQVVSCENGCKLVIGQDLKAIANC